jgi:arylsulfatase A-like enzyme
MVARAAGRLALALILGACAPPSRPPRHLVLISVDTLRADHVGPQGDRPGLTPEIDALASGSQRFPVAYAPAPITLPSVVSLLTGRYPDEVAVRSNLAVVPGGVPTLASRLRDEGWKTGAVVSNLVLRERAGLNAGFDRYDADLPDAEARRGTPERTAAATTDAAIAMLGALLVDEATRVFLWVHYQDPHGPYTPPDALRQRRLEQELRAPGGLRELKVSPGWRGIGALPSYQYLPPHRQVAFYRAGYAGEVAYLDEQVGRLLDGLAERGILDRAVVVFTADHGESLGEDDYWFAHGEHLTEPSVRVPLFFRVPGLTGASHSQTASLVDVLPTLAAIFDFETAPDLRGIDLLSSAPAPAERTVYFRTLDGASRARSGLVRDGYKLVRTEREGGAEVRLFQLPDETRDLAARSPELAQSLARELDAGRLEPGFEAEAPRLSEADREAFRALGYATD